MQQAVVADIPTSSNHLNIGYLLARASVASTLPSAANILIMNKLCS